jgi:hypothetical protein
MPIIKKSLVVREKLVSQGIKERLLADAGD